MSLAQALVERAGAEDECVRDLRRAISARVKTSAVVRACATPDALRSRGELLDPELGRLRDVAQPGGFRRHHLRQSPATSGREYVKSSLLQVLEPQLAFSRLGPEEGGGAAACAKKSSNLATALVIAKCCFGSAFLIVPHGFKEAGVIAGPLCLIVVYAFMLAGMLKLIECRRTWGRSITFQEMGSALGSWGTAYVKSGLMLLSAGFCCIWVVTCTENLSAVVPEWGSSARLWATFPFVLPLTLVRRLKVLTVTNILGIALCTCTSVYLSWLAMDRLGTHGVQDVILVNTANADTLLWVGACGYIFELITVVVPIYEAAADQEAMPKLLIGITLGVLALYIGIGVVFYCAYGEETADLATLNLPQHTVSRYVFPALFVIVGIVSQPVSFFVLAQVYEPSVQWSEASLARKWQKNFARTCVVLAVYSLTWLGGAQLQNFLALVGGLLGSNLAINVPVLLHLALCKPTGLAWAWDWATFVAGVAIMVCSTYQAVATWK